MEGQKSNFPVYENRQNSFFIKRVKGRLLARIQKVDVQNVKMCYRARWNNIYRSVWKIKWFSLKSGPSTGQPNAHLARSQVEGIVILALMDMTSNSLCMDDDNLWKMCSCFSFEVLGIGSSSPSWIPVKTLTYASFYSGVSMCTGEL